jgi:hypothetical protein
MRAMTSINRAVGIDDDARCGAHVHNVPLEQHNCVTTPRRCAAQRCQCSGRPHVQTVLPRQVHCPNVAPNDENACGLAGQLAGTQALLSMLSAQASLPSYHERATNRSAVRGPERAATRGVTAHTWTRCRTTKGKFFSTRRRRCRSINGRPDAVRRHAARPTRMSFTLSGAMPWLIRRLSKLSS